MPTKRLNRKARLSVPLSIYLINLPDSFLVTTRPQIETTLYGGSVEEVYAAGKPHPSLQGCIYGVFRNRSPIEGRAVTFFLLFIHP